MKKYQYPLRKVQQVREIELSIAAEALREMQEQIAKVEKMIAQHRSNIDAAHRRLADSERTTGQISLELRSATTAYVNVLQEETRLLDKMLAELYEQKVALHRQVVEKKQGTKILEKHSERLAARHAHETFVAEVRESDELWLTRVGRNS